MAEEQQPSLGQLIWLVRRELEWAYAADADQPLRFEVGPVELDLGRVPWILMPGWCRSVRCSIG